MSFLYKYNEHWPWWARERNSPSVRWETHTSNLKVLMYKGGNVLNESGIHSRMSRVVEHVATSWRIVVQGGRFLRASKWDNVQGCCEWLPFKEPPRKRTMITGKSTHRLSGIEARFIFRMCKFTTLTKSEVDLHFIFMPLIQKQLDTFRQAWAMHPLRTESDTRFMRSFLWESRRYGNCSGKVTFEC